MYIIATYTGKDGSLGYRTGRKYHLRIEGMTIRRVLTGDGVCEYQSLQAFLLNWTDPLKVAAAGFKTLAMQQAEDYDERS